MKTGWLTVVAGALQRGDGRWLMHRRPEGKHHAGLWEFPGGKVEPAEMPLDSLVRELEEELGVVANPGLCAPAGFAHSGIAGETGAIVILLYKVGSWDGEPAALEGGSVDWFTPEQIAALPKPPLDIALAAQLFQKF